MKVFIFYHTSSMINFIDTHLYFIWFHHSYIRLQVRFNLEIGIFH